MGEVKGRAAPVTEFTVDVNGKQVPIVEAPLVATNVSPPNESPEDYEYFVPIKWLKTLPKEKAYWEKGLFASQHTACRLRNRFTLERLTRHFGLDD